MTAHSATLRPVIEVSGLTKRFRGRVAVEDVSFSVPAGAVCALLGPNGSGKTTTLRCLVGLARADAGTVTIAGGVPGAVLDGFGAHPTRTGRDHLRMLAAAAGRDGGAQHDVLLEHVGLSAEDADRRAGEYSLGMTRRLMLAAALLREPRVLVLDEPENGLDPQGVRWLRDLVRAHADGGGAVLISTHALAEVARVADRAVILHRGRVAAALDAVDDDLEERYLEATA